MQINKYNTSHQQSQKQKTHVISIDVEKSLDKFQHLFIIKTLQKIGIHGGYLKLIKAIYDKAQPTLY